jgi:hypothetical protein
MMITLTKHEMAWTHDEPRRVFQYDVRGYPPGEGASIAQDAHHGWSIMRWNETEQTDWMEDFSTADAALSELQARFDLGDSAFISSRKIEGSLDILWMNFERRDHTPVLGMHFMPYRSFKDGAQKRKELTGKDALKRYLEQLGFALLRIYEIMGHVEAHYSADLPNVLMNEYHYAMTYRN